MSPGMTTVAQPGSRAGPTFGHVLREWRQRRRLSQLALALDAGVSQRHLSFVESGRAQPSREMVLRLAEQLAVPLRERNRLLLTAGYAPSFGERSLDDPALEPVRLAVERVLEAHAPYPAIAVDRHWNLVAANGSVAPILACAAPPLLQSPVNVLRLSLHPDGLAPRIVNLRQWGRQLLERLQRQVEVSGDPKLDELLSELRTYSLAPGRGGSSGPHGVRDDGGDVFIPFQLATDDGSVLSFIGTTMVFGTPVDVTVSELAVECFFPADAETAERLRNAPAA